MTPSAKVRRGHARTALLNAARALFGDVGYAAATTQDIAVKAGVSETLIFRYFGSKSSLFVEAVLTPMADFVSKLVKAGQADLDAIDRNNEEIINRYIDDLSSALPHSGQLSRATLEVVNSHSADPEIAAFRTRLAGLFDELAIGMKTYLQQGGFRDADPRLAVRMGFLLVSAMSAMLPLTYSDTDTLPSAQQVKTELTAFMLYGLQNPKGRGLPVPEQRGLR
jgi:AcrR family transcriptional regulator